MRLGIDVTCRGCGADVSIVNPGRSDGLEAKAVLGCSTCGLEWLLVTQIEPVCENPLTRGRANKRSSEAIVALADEARQLVAAKSHGIKAACQAVGIDRETYRRHARRALSVS